MKKNMAGCIIILSTFISVIIMSSYNGYIINAYEYKDGKIQKQAVSESNSSAVPSKNTTNYVQNKEAEENLYVKDNLNVNDLSQNKISSNPQSGDSTAQSGDSNSKIGDSNNSGNSHVNSSNVDIGKTSTRIYIYNGLYGPQKSDSLDEYDYDYDYDDKEKEQSVFKVSTSKIVENLTTSDKMKLLYISIKLGKEDYNRVEKYLYADDAEDGVLKALKLLKESLSEKEYEKVRSIAGRFIDMEAAEKLY